MSDLETTPSSTRSLEPNLKTPEFNVLEKAENNVIGWFYFFNQITRLSKMTQRHYAGKERPERSLLLRKLRADIYKNIQNVPVGENQRKERVRFLQEASVREKIAAQFLQQKEVIIGQESARFVQLEPPEELATKKDKPPLVLIPGFANDLDPVGMLAQELVFQGRNVIVIAYPESTLGHISQEYKEKALTSPYYETQSQFFKEAINEIIGDEREFELWSHSTGGPISADILRDESFQKRVKNAVLLSPIGGIDQSKTSFSLGIVQELATGLRLKTNKGNIKELAKYSFVLPFDQQEPGQKPLKRAVFNNLLAKVCKQYPYWDEMRVAGEGKIIVWSAEKDQLSKTAQAHKMLTQSPQAVLITDQEASHASGLLAPLEAIAPIEKILYETL